jgi:hypothetical protein
VLGVMAICSGLHHLWMIEGGQRARLWHRAHRAFRSLHAVRRWRGPVHQCRPDLSLPGSGRSPRSPRGS